MKKLSNTEAEWKISVAYKKACIVDPFLTKIVKLINYNLKYDYSEL